MVMLAVGWTWLECQYGLACPAGLVVLPGVGVNITKFQHRVPDEYRAAVPFPVAIVPSELVTAG